VTYLFKFMPIYNVKKHSMVNNWSYFFLKSTIFNHFAVRYILYYTTCFAIIMLLFI